MTDPMPEPQGDNAQGRLLEELTALLAPLDLAAVNPGRRKELLDELGWDLAAVSGMPAEEFTQWLAAVAELVGRLAELAKNPPSSLDELKTALESARGAFDTVRNLPPALRSGPQLPPAELLAEDLVTHLTVRFLETRHPLGYLVLVLLGVVTPAADRPADPPFPAPPLLPVRQQRSRPRLDLKRLSDLVSDPVGTLAALYFPAGFDSAASVRAGTDLLFPRLKALLDHLGLPALYGLPPGAGPDLGEIGAELAAGMLTLGRSTLVDGVEVRAGATIGLDSAEEGGLGLLVVPSAAVSREFDAGGWQITFLAEAGELPFALGPSGLTLPEGVHGAVSASVTAERPGTKGRPAVLLGSVSGTRLEIGGIRLSAGFRFDSDGEDDDVALSVDFDDAVLVVVPGDDAGPLQYLFPEEGLRVEADLGLGWSLRQGLTLRGGAGLDVPLPAHLSLPGLDVDGVHISLTAGAEGLALSVTAGAVLRLGPVTAAADRIGITARLGFPEGGGNIGPADADLVFQRPAGLGLAVRSGPLTGGGYLFADHERHQYAGVLELRFQAIAVKAVGLLSSTPYGFSLLVIVSAEFPPLQIGFGFTLNGVGGLLGINRSADLEALRSGVRSGGLDAILFPPDPVGRAAEIVSTVDKAFPAAEGRYVFGPMARLGWGSPTLLTLDLALILELPSPVRLLVLGRLRMALPDEQHAVVRINMDVLGVVDFDRREASVDASLFDSQVAGFALTGDMAMRASWGSSPSFALAAGGFNPRFQPPPGFPALKRMTIALASGDNPRIRLESYLALTSNTVQFGGRMEVHAKVSKFSISGMLSLDALVCFDPFGFTVDIGAMVDVRAGGTSLLAVMLSLTITGPRPWRVTGHAKFTILFVKVTIPVRLTVGDARPLPPPPSVGVSALLAEAFADPRNWSAQLPSEGAEAVTLRRIEPKAGEVLAHPLGTVTVTQKTAPLGVRVDRFGNAPASDPGVHRAVVSLGGAATAAPETVTELFALGQFQEMTEEQKLAAASFTRLPAGYRFGGTARRFDTEAPAAYVPAYEELLVDDVRRPAARSAAAAPLTGPELGLLARTGSAGRAPIRSAGAAGYRPRTARPLITLVDA
ncbi:DUF6603 domain-containing protein [Streptomyces sp. NPDC056361]|uniref:DUF6603 domain-containing protein n=1 Tax=Streptomyces sp. NPDC056361 TaxID=3345795 RepID=UPI0035D7B89C